MTLERVDTYRYLGVHITSNLSWESHVHHVISNANRMLGYLKRNFFQTPSTLKLFFYKTLVRPKLEYASAVWDPNTESLVGALEAVQNRSVRFILSNYHRTSSVTSMKKCLSLPTLSLRRKFYRLSLFQKIFFHNPILKTELLLEPSYISSRNDHIHKVEIPQCHTNTYYRSFIPRTSADWNHLSTSIATIVNPVDFKNAVSILLELD